MKLIRITSLVMQDKLLTLWTCMYLSKGSTSLNTKFCKASFRPFGSWKTQLYWYLQTLAPPFSCKQHSTYKFKSIYINLLTSLPTWQTISSRDPGLRSRGWAIFQQIKSSPNKSNQMQTTVQKCYTQKPRNTPTRAAVATTEQWERTITGSNKSKLIENNNNSLYYYYCSESRADIEVKWSSFGERFEFVSPALVVCR